MSKSTSTGAALAERSLRILVSPTPATFAERRSVLHALEQHGRMVHFKGTPGYSSNFVSITKDAEAARKLVASSPIHYGMMLPQIETDPALADLEETGLMEKVRVETVYADDGPRDRKEFTLHIYPNPQYNHEHSMTSSPLYDAWPDAYQRDHSFAATTLKQSLPHNIARKGLAHWLVDNDGATRQSPANRRIEANAWLPSRMKRAGDASKADEGGLESRSTAGPLKNMKQPWVYGQLSSGTSSIRAGSKVKADEASLRSGSKMRLWEEVEESKVIGGSSSPDPMRKAKSKVKASEVPDKVPDALDKMKESRVHEGSKNHSGKQTLTW